MDTPIAFSSLLGKTITEILGKVGDDKLTFQASDGSRYRLYHEYDCCESVRIEDIAGDLSDLLGAPIVRAEEPSSLDRFEEKPINQDDDSFTWTFYILGTAKGTVTIRWYGTSNGYYGEGVGFEMVTEA